MSKKLLLILTILFVTLITSFSLADEAYKVVIEDDADLLSAEEEENLKATMIKLTEYGNAYFKSTNESYGTTGQYAHDIYYNMFGSDSGSLFLIDMHNREIYIHSDGYNYLIINRSKALSITDNTYRYASNKQYFECANKAFEQMNTILSGGKILEPMIYICNALLSIIIASTILFLYISKNSKTAKPSKDKIVKNCDIKFVINNTSAESLGQSRVYSPQSDSSGGGGSSRGGGGGHGSHGSHSSGGGGGHRF